MPLTGSDFLSAKMSSQPVYFKKYAILLGEVSRRIKCVGQKSQRHFQLSLSKWTLTP